MNVIQVATLLILVMTALTLVAGLYALRNGNR